MKRKMRTRKMRTIGIAIIIFISFLTIEPKLGFAESENSQFEISGNEFIASLDEMILEADSGFNTQITPDYHTKRLIVKTKDNEAIESHGAVASVEGFQGLHIFQYATIAETDSAMELFSADEEIDSVELDYKVYIETENTNAVNYPQFDVVPTKNDWPCSIINTSDALSKIENTSNRDVVVAVLDTGMDYNHEFFDQSRVIDSGSSAFSSSTEDDNGHGTYVAGIIYNNTPSNVKLCIYKMLNSDGSGPYYYTSKIIATIETAANSNCDVINMSFAMGVTSISNSKAFISAIATAYSNNIPVVAAAGNSGIALSGLEMPASIEKVITVSAIDSSLLPSSFSNYGSSVNISAPGKRINSSIPFHNNLYTSILDENDEEQTVYYDGHVYATASGTSAAAPFVSAACAILKTVNKDYTVDEITSILQLSAYKPSAWDETMFEKYGAGILDMSAMLNIQRSKTPQIMRTENGVVIFAKTPGVKIFFTTDNSIPTVDSPEYTGIITNTQSIGVIKAIAVEEGKLPSNVESCILGLKDSVTVRYKGTKKVRFPNGFKAKSIKNYNEGIAEMTDDGIINGYTIGKATTIVYSTKCQHITYDIKVEYAWWQQLIRWFLFGFLWY